MWCPDLPGGGSRVHGSHEGGGVRLEGGDGLVGVHAPALPVVQAHHVRHHDQPCFLSLDMQGKKSTHTQPKNMSLSPSFFPVVVAVAPPASVNSL